MSEVESKRIFSKKFNALLLNQHVTQKEIACICGASTSTVSTWSKGINMPRMDKIEKLANYFGLPKSYFIEETEKAPTPVSGSGRAQNIIKIAGRDGSYVEKKLTDEQIAAMKALIDTLPDAPDDL